MIPNQKELFAIPEGVNFLNCANMAPQLNAITEAGYQSVKQKSTPWTIQPADWFKASEELRHVAATICNATADDMAIIPATSYGIAIAAKNLPVQAGGNLILLDQEYPSNVYAWWELAKANNLTVTYVKRDKGTWTESVVQAIDAKTVIVSVPNCHWTDGSLIDLHQVSEKARQVGASLVVDASQSLGAYPIDVQRIKPDFMVCVGYKWLLGPYALGYLYVSPKWHNGAPIENSWLNRSGSEDFTRLVDYKTSYRPGARRYDMGEFPNFVLTPMAITALKQIVDWGISNVQQTLGLLTDFLSEQASSMGYTVANPSERVQHMIGLHSPVPFSPELKQKLQSENIFVSFRGDSMRVAPHVYTDLNDIRQLVDILSQAKNGGGLSRGEKRIGLYGLYSASVRQMWQ